MTSYWYFHHTWRLPTRVVCHVVLKASESPQSRKQTTEYVTERVAGAYFIWVYNQLGRWYNNISINDWGNYLHKRTLRFSKKKNLRLTNQMYSRIRSWWQTARESTEQKTRPWRRLSAQKAVYIQTGTETQRTLLDLSKICWNYSNWLNNFNIKTNLTIW